MPFVLEVTDWETLKQLAKKFDLLCLVRETADAEVHYLIGAKYKADHISETHIEFHVVKAEEEAERSRGGERSGKEVLKEFFGEATKGQPFYKRMVELYANYGIRIYYAKQK